MRSHPIEIPYEAPAGRRRGENEAQRAESPTFGPQRRRVGEIVYEEIEGVENGFLCIARDRKHHKNTMAAKESERLTVADRSEQKHKLHNARKHRMIRQSRNVQRRHTPQRST